MTRLGVFATAEEVEDLKRPRPVMYFGSQPDPKRPGEFLPITMESALESCHRYALGHGLPEFDGYYGCDLVTGEFVKP